MKQAVCQVISKGSPNKHLHYEKGMTISHAIATGVNTVKRWCTGGTVSSTKGPTKSNNVKPDTKAKACAAVAEWEAKKAGNKAKKLKESDISAEAEVLTDDDKRTLIEATRKRLALVENLIYPLGRPGARTPTRDAALELMESSDVTEVKLRIGGRRLTKEEAAETRRVLSHERAELRALLESLGAPPEAPKKNPLDDAMSRVDKVSKMTDADRLNIERGSSGEEVKLAQERLSELGYQLQTDGEFGPITETAVKSFQADHSLKPDGKVHRQTRMALRGTTTEDVADRKGVSPGSIETGVPGEGNPLDDNPNTAAATTGAAPAESAAPAEMDDSPPEEKDGAEDVLAEDDSVDLKPFDWLTRGRGVDGTPDPKVKAAQSALQEMGTYIGEAGPDGRFGPETEAGTMRVQRRYGLKPDGLIGPKTSEVLERYAPGAMKADNDEDSGDEDTEKPDTDDSHTEPDADENGGPDDADGDEQEPDADEDGGPEDEDEDDNKFPNNLKKKRKGLQEASTQAELVATRDASKINGVQGNNSKYDEKKHPRAEKGNPNGGQFVGKGDSGAEVSGVQAELGMEDASGKFDSATVQAVKEYQRENGLLVDGIVGSQTAASMQGREAKVGALSKADRRFLRKSGRSLEEASLRGAARQAMDTLRDVTQIKRLPDGTFAPKGRGMVLRPGQEVSVPRRRGDSGPNVRGKVGRNGKVELMDGPDKGKSIDLQPGAVRPEAQASPPTGGVDLRSFQQSPQGKGPIIDVGDDVNRAADLLATGHRVKLDQPRTVSILLDELDKRVKNAIELGDDAPNFNLCDISVPNTNLFCAESKGIPRVHMPQLSGVPLPGSKADSMEKNDKGEVDLSDLFRQSLIDEGIAVEEATEKAAYLRATQNELNGAKVAGIAGAVKSGKLDLSTKSPLFVSQDNYIVDGHHRWAALVGVDSADNELGDPEGPEQRVERIDLDIIEILERSNAFAEEYGIPQAAVGDNKALEAEKAKKAGGDGQASPGAQSDGPMTEDEARAILSDPAYDAYGGFRLYGDLEDGQRVSIKSTAQLDKYLAQDNPLTKIEGRSNNGYAPIGQASPSIGPAAGESVNIPGLGTMVGLGKTPEAAEAERKQRIEQAEQSIADATKRKAELEAELEAATDPAEVEDLKGRIFRQDSILRGAAKERAVAKGQISSTMDPLPDELKPAALGEDTPKFYGSQASPGTGGGVGELDAGEADDFRQGYARAMVWANGSDAEGNMLDFPSGDNEAAADEYLSKMSPEVRAQLDAQADEFMREAGPELRAAMESGDYDASQAGHDFALTRSGHGAGFWDRDLGDTGEALTSKAESYGEANVTDLDPEDPSAWDVWPPTQPGQASPGVTEVGGTPFRPEDANDPEGFQRKLSDYKARFSEAVTAFGVPEAEHEEQKGVWGGEEEPSVRTSIETDDPEVGLAAAAALGRHYGQDGMAVFTPSEDGAGGRFAVDIPEGMSEDEVRSQIAEGMPEGQGASVAGGKAYFYSHDYDEGVEWADGLAESLGSDGWDAESGTFTLVSDNEYGDISYEEAIGSRSGEAGALSELWQGQDRDNAPDGGGSEGDGQGQASPGDGEVGPRSDEWGTLPGRDGEWWYRDSETGDLNGPYQSKGEADRANAPDPENPFSRPTPSVREINDVAERPFAGESGRKEMGNGWVMEDMTKDPNGGILSPDYAVGPEYSARYTFTDPETGEGVTVDRTIGITYDEETGEFGVVEQTETRAPDDEGGDTSDYVYRNLYKPDGTGFDSLSDADVWASEWMEKGTEGRWANNPLADLIAQLNEPYMDNLGMQSMDRPMDNLPQAVKDQISQISDDGSIRPPGVSEDQMAFDTGQASPSTSDLEAELGALKARLPEYGGFTGTAETDPEKLAQIRSALASGEQQLADRGANEQAARLGTYDRLSSVAAGDLSPALGQASPGEGAAKSLDDYTPEEWAAASEAEKMAALNQQLDSLGFDSINIESGQGTVGQHEPGAIGKAGSLSVGEKFQGSGPETWEATEVGSTWVKARDTATGREGTFHHADSVRYMSPETGHMGDANSGQASPAPGPGVPDPGALPEGTVIEFGPGSKRVTLSGPPAPGETRRAYDDDGRAYDIPPDRLGAGSVVNQPGQASPADQSTDDFYTYNSQSQQADLDNPDDWKYISTPEIAAIQNVESYRPMTDAEVEKVRELQKAEAARLKATGGSISPPSVYPEQRSPSTSSPQAGAVATQLGGGWTPEAVDAAIGQLASTGINLDPANDPPEAIAAVIRAANITVEEMQRMLSREFGQPEIGTV